MSHRVSKSKRRRNPWKEPELQRLQKLLAEIPRLTHAQIKDRLEGESYPRRGQRSVSVKICEIRKKEKESCETLQPDNPSSRDEDHENLANETETQVDGVIPTGRPFSVPPPDIGNPSTTINSPPDATDVDVSQVQNAHRGTTPPGEPPMPVVQLAPPLPLPEEHMENVHNEATSSTEDAQPRDVHGGTTPPEEPESSDAHRESSLPERPRIQRAHYEALVPEEPQTQGTSGNDLLTTCQHFKDLLSKDTQAAQGRAEHRRPVEMRHNENSDALLKTLERGETLSEREKALEEQLRSVRIQLVENRRETDVLAEKVVTDQKLLDQWREEDEQETDRLLAVQKLIDQRLEVTGRLWAGI
ncbi:uncharacterized protein K452DRAFT_341124 [Aplosporella prunicola CBS 121167]|uniref:Uncharacterized protein n=1 Tax=Aplosporella prunicola CBS 121167 TaxID=1176127 RepID=A0A6A6AZL3_9PEZI|nr:uncharacterized protein K452DRAFT_341124 [Aplosporella prunicola CBS 121167]KAF2137382.1 hypothetical protein K452DRAFT_341124 [Aplosporella prunicola CBS 121167]